MPEEAGEGDPGAASARRAGLGTDLKAHVAVETKGESLEWETETGARRDL